MKKHLRLILIITGILIAILVITFSVMSLFNSDWRNKSLFTLSSESTNLVINNTYDSLPDRIYIKSKVNNINIYNSKENKTVLKIYGDKDSQTINFNNNKLFINSTIKECSSFCFNSKVGKIELYLPSNYDKELRIEGTDGNILINEYPDMNLIINLNNGNIDISKIGDANIKLNSGNINIIEGNNINIDSKLGNVDLGNIKILDALINSGDTTIKSILNKINLTTKSGIIKINELNILESSSIINNFGNTYIGKTNDIKINSLCSLGDIKINNNNEKSELILDIKNDYGNIKINN